MSEYAAAEERAASEKVEDTTTTPTPTPMPPIPVVMTDENGNTLKVRDRLMGYSFILCVVIMGTLAGVCMFKPPQDWNVINTVIGHLKEFALVILTGYFTLRQPD